MNGCGYDWSYPITPYIHILNNHIGQIMRKFRGSMKLFSGQGEKLFPKPLKPKKNTKRIYYKFLTIN